MWAGHKKIHKIKWSNVNVCIDIDDDDDDVHKGKRKRTGKSIWRVSSSSSSSSSSAPLLPLPVAQMWDKFNLLSTWVQALMLCLRGRLGEQGNWKLKANYVAEAYDSNAQYQFQMLLGIVGRAKLPYRKPGNSPRPKMACSKLELEHMQISIRN